MQNKAQGTIEYLVIIGVVVVLGLVVVGLLSSFGSQAQQVSTTGQKIQNLTKSGISIIDSVSDVEGDSLFSLRNNSGETITLTEISNGSNVNNFNEVLPQNDTRTFSISDLDLTCPCEAGASKKVCEFTFKFKSSLNLDKEEKITLTVDCVSNSTPSNEESVIGLGNGSLDKPFIISSCIELQSIYKDLDANYALNTDIDCSDSRNWNNGKGFVPIGYDYDGTSGLETDEILYGTFDGRRHVVRGVYINRPTEHYVGFFGYLPGKVINLGLEDINITGNDSVGGLVGKNWGTILNSYTKGNVYGGYSLGGLVGLNAMDINSSFSDANVTWFNIGLPNSFAGGLVGQNSGVSFYGTRGTIYNCYSTGKVTATTVGFAGLAGGNFWPNAKINYSFSTSQIIGAQGLGFTDNASGVVNGSYWDVNTSEKTSSGGVATGKTTIQMKQQNTFSGWDFSTIWRICEGTSYPFLAWENRTC